MCYLFQNPICIFCLGDKALHQILEEAHKVADRCTNPHDRDLILKCTGDVESMVDALSELRQQGKVRNVISNCSVWLKSITSNFSW